MTDGTSGGATAGRLRDRKPSRKRPVTDGRTTDRPTGAAPAARRRRRLHLLPRHRAQIEALLREHLPDVEVWAYGSRVSGDSHDGSDLDLVLRAPGLEKVPMDPLCDLWEVLRDSTIPFLVEARDWARLPESFHGEIERDYVVLVKGAPDCAKHADGSTETAATTEPAKRHLRPGRHRHWKEYAVRELIDTGSLEIGDGYRAKNSELSNSGLPFARAGNIRDGFHFDDADCFPAENLHRVKNKASIPGDVVFTSKGTVGRFGFVREHTPRFVYSPQLCFWRSLDTALIDPRYLFYWMSGPDFFRQFKEVSGQTDMAEFVSLRDQRDMRIDLPPVREQRAIACVLGALDDRIELNHRMTATLEAMARALFRSWFVDFDPVRAKMAGCDPGLPKEIADLFPDRLVTSELGKIPDGWTVRLLGEDVDTVKGRSYKSQELIDSETALVTLKSFSPRGGYRPGGLKSFSGKYSQDQVVLPGEVVISCTDVTQAGAIVGRPAIVQASAIHKTLVASLDMFIVRPKHQNNGLTTSFFYYLACTNNFKTHTYALTTGTTVLHLDKNAIPSFSFVRPPKDLIRLFDDVARPMLESIRMSLQCTDSLAGLRDVLLPKLVSGDVQIGKKLAHRGQ